MRLGATVTGRMEVDEGEIISLPAIALTRQGDEPAVWVVDPADRDGGAARDRRAPLRAGLRRRRRRACSPATSWSPPACRPCIPGQKVRLLGAALVSGFNLSGWALRNRSVVVYLMLARGGRRRARLRQARPQRGPRLHHPHHGRGGRLAGRHARRDTLLQVTERLERKLQEMPGLDVLRSYTRPGRHDDLRRPPGQRDRRPRCRSTWQRVRNDVDDIWHTLPARRGRARSSTTASATCSASSTASPPTASPIASCATMSRTSAPSCCTCPTSRRSTSSAPRTR